ncbi:hypothetical protein DICSQDRAFT_132771 [Dichomitus squalens LYAD-421 SS1]|uniref:uncharacterized protein n=1 Tax=Dichomitus squalens (strain LYAD-421) TaxID=732165 RepID=UPI00044156BA|nr:uncharacterized protein DICSQDRAFT_132771 [Dichomitus squalens LYAD-421 SS1]EJF65217.1 hypothetical protein DICSQDRAFT_132771 [Dichomitus squalens LYAD-421 SS1]
MSTEQVLHDRVNLARLVHRLEKMVADETWMEDVAGSSTSTPAWIRTRGTLQKVKHARKLLQNVEVNDDAVDSAAPRRYDEFRRTLDRLESLVSEVDKRVAPIISKPVPILPNIPPPISVPVPSSAEESLPDTGSSPSDPTATLLPVEETSAIAAHGLLLTSSDSHTLPRGPINPSEALLPPSRPAAAEKSGTQATPAFMQNSAALQEELSAQLAQMATQLKRNAVHFASALEKDNAVVQETQEKLERNHGVMTKERVRLRDHHSKSWGTTWITMLSLLVVLIGFIMTFLVIRIT